MSDYMDSYTKFVDKVRQRPGVQGLILGGSRGRRFESDDSDTDVFLIIDDSMSSRDVARLRGDMIQEFGKSTRLDLSYHAIQSLSAFRDYALYGTEFMWDRYSLVNVKLEFDNSDGLLTRAFHDKQRLTAAETEIGMARFYPAYLNKAYRSIVCAQRKQTVGAQLDAATSIDFLVGSLFTLHRRVPPYNKYLVWELEQEPLIAIDSDELIMTLQAIVVSSSVAGQQRLFALLAELATEQGYGNLLEPWNTKLDRIQSE